MYNGDLVHVKQMLALLQNLAIIDIFLRILAYFSEFDLFQICTVNRYNEGLLHVKHMLAPAKIW